MRYISFLVIPCFVFLLARSYASNSQYLARVLATHGIYIRGEIVSVSVLSEHSSNLGNSGHRTVRISLTDVGFAELVHKIGTVANAGHHPILPISGFGNTLTSETATYTYYSETDEELLVVFADEANKTAEVVIAW